MFLKLIFAIIVMAGLGLGILSLRQQRLDALHEMMTIHTQMDRTRKATWNLQTKIARDSDPVTLEAKLAAAGITLVPLTDHGTAAINSHDKLGAPKATLTSQTTAIDHR